MIAFNDIHEGSGEHNNWTMSSRDLEILLPLCERV